jgi:5'-nucleotidase
VSSPKPRRGRGERPLILLTNDDGFFQETIQILFRRLRPIGQTYIVAPDREKSASSLAITLRQPLRLHHIKPRVWAVEGTPGDCIYFALQKLLPRRPDLIISGINPGPNLGQQDVNYSGTVAGALQGTFLGVPSIAVSMLPDACGRFAAAPAADIVRRIAESILTSGLPAGVTLNVNIPPPPVLGVKVTRLGWKFYDPEIIEKKDPRNSAYFWIGTGTPKRVGGDDSDVIAAHQGYVSLTPLHTDMTAHHALASPGLRRIARSIAASGPCVYPHSRS